MRNSAISTIPLLVSLHLRFMTPWSRLLRCRCEQLQGRFDAKACVGWNIYSTNLAWPGWTTSMENYLQVTNLDHIILPCHGMPWGDLVPAPPCTTTVRSLPSAELKIPFVPATRIRQRLVGSVRTNASRGDKQLWKQGYLKCFHVWIFLILILAFHRGPLGKYQIKHHCLKNEKLVMLVWTGHSDQKHETLQDHAELIQTNDKKYLQFPPKQKSLV